MFIGHGNHKFSEAPLGSTECRSCGASDSFINSDSINIQPLCGCKETESVNLALRLGLLCVKGLREEAGRAIVRARAQRSFSSLDDLHRRVPELRNSELRKLAAVGALNRIEGRGDRVLGVGSEEVRGQRSGVSNLSSKSLR